MKHPTVLHIASEVEPFSKTGGLADVAGALPRALEASGFKCVVVTPLYASIDPARHGLARRLRPVTVELGDERIDVIVYEGTLRGGRVPVFLIDHEVYRRKGLCGEGGEDYPDNAKRFALLSAGALAVCDALGIEVDIVHAHDWHAGLAPVFARAAGKSSVFTIHNAAFAGRFPAADVAGLGIPPEVFEPSGEILYLKAGIVAADLVTTVSPRYARELQTEEFGGALCDFYRANKAKLSGIANGIDQATWNPATDPHLPARYSADDLDGKAMCKAELRREVGLAASATDAPDPPLFGVVSRLA
ncbi:MAG: glycogen/starch synthase, partial [Myxococcota bacterium]